MLGTEKIASRAPGGLHLRHVREDTVLDYGCPGNKMRITTEAVETIEARFQKDNDGSEHLGV